MSEVFIKKRKKGVWRTPSSLVSIELKWGDIEHKKYLVRCEKLWKDIKEKHKWEREFEKYHIKKCTQAIGPSWYHELSNPQRDSLDTLALMMHMDIGQGTPSRTMRILADLGILPRYKSLTVMRALKKSEEIPSLFLRELYTSIYDNDAITRIDRYILEQKLIISAIVYLGTTDFLKALDALTKYTYPPSVPKTTPPSVKKPPPAKSVYLEPSPFIPLVPTEMYTPRPPPTAPVPLPDKYKIKLCPKTEKEEGSNSIISETSNTKGLKNAVSSSEKKSTEEKKSASIVSSKSKSGKRVSESPPAHSSSSTVNVIVPTDVFDTCKMDCGCVKWYPAIIKYVQEKKRREEAERLKNKPIPEKGKKDNKPDKGSKENEKKKKKRRLKKKKNTVKKFRYPFTINDFLKVLLGELAEQGYWLAMLPDLYKLPILQEWARNRLYGGIWPEEKDRLLKASRSKWKFLTTLRTRVSPPDMPISQKEKCNMTWDYRGKINKMVSNLHEQFHKKLKRKLINVAQTWWPTMEMEKFPNTTFRDVYFSYLPGKEEDLFVI